MLQKINWSDASYCQTKITYSKWQIYSTRIFGTLHGPHSWAYRLTVLVSNSNSICTNLIPYPLSLITTNQTSSPSNQTSSQATWHPPQTTQHLTYLYPHIHLRDIYLREGRTDSELSKKVLLHNQGNGYTICYEQGTKFSLQSLFWKTTYCYLHSYFLDESKT